MLLTTELTIMKCCIHVVRDTENNIWYFSIQKKGTDPRAQNDNFQIEKNYIVAIKTTGKTSKVIKLHNEDTYISTKSW